MGNDIRYSIHMKPQSREEFNSVLSSKLVRNRFGDGDHLDLLFGISVMPTENEVKRKVDDIR